MMWQKRRVWMWLAMLVFVLTASGAILVNSFWLGDGLHFSYSISKYVGSATWSVVIFALGNVLVARWMAKYLYSLGRSWKFSRWFFWAVVVMAVALLGLSAFPTYYFDLGTAKSLISFVHEICSRLMFAVMLVVAMRLALTGMASWGSRRRSAEFVLYGLLCIFGFFSKAEWFAAWLLVFESCYLLGFMALCLGLKDKTKVSLEEKCDEQEA